MPLPPGRAAKKDHRKHRGIAFSLLDNIPSKCLPHAIAPFIIRVSDRGDEPIGKGTRAPLSQSWYYITGTELRGPTLKMPALPGARHSQFVQPKTTYPHLWHVYCFINCEDEYLVEGRGSKWPRIASQGAVRAAAV